MTGTGEDSTGELTLVILAAGAGRRFGGLKQLEPVGPAGEAIIDYSIHDAWRAGFSRVALVIREETEDEFRRSLDARIPGRVPVSYVHQHLDDLPDDRADKVQLPTARHKPWGTGQAVLAAQAHVREAFVVINADDFYGRDAFAALAAFLGTTRQGMSPSSRRGMSQGSSPGGVPAKPGPPPAFAMVGYRLTDSLIDSGTVSRALCRRAADGWLGEIVEVPAIEKHGSDGRYEDAEGRVMVVPGDTLISLNIWGFTPAVFPLLREAFGRFLQERGRESDSEFLLPDFIRESIRQDRARVKVLPGGDLSFGMTYAEDRAGVAERIARLIARGDYPEKLWA